MRQVKLGIYDYAQSYAMGLMTYINADAENSIFAMAFSSKEKLLAYLEDNHMDILLVAEKNSQDAEIMQMATKRNLCVLVLAEQPSTDDRRSLYRYACASELVKHILLAFRAEHAGRERSGVFACYGVISPLGRCGKTSLAKCICMSDEVRGGLYIGMEAYGESEDDSPYTMGDLAYLMKLRSDEMIAYVEQSIVRDGRVHRIPSPESYLDLRELTAQDFRWFFDRLIDWGRYTTIVCDMEGSALGDLAILGEFDHIIVPTLQQEGAAGKLAAFESLLRKKEMGKTADRMRMEVVPDAAYDSAEMLRFVGKLVEM